jgi:hypothetical protein
MVVDMERVSKGIDPERFGKMSTDERRADQVAYCSVGPFSDSIQLR